MDSMNREIAIIGGGAAGFFAAITVAANFPQHHVTMYEKSNKLLSKVRVSGGGRCNVTHSCFDVRQLIKNYPRGEKQLISAFSRFGVTDTIQWFEERGVELKTEEDGRMFPVTNRSQTIVNCLLGEAEHLGVNIVLNAELTKLAKRNSGKFELTFKDANVKVADRVLISAGGHPRAGSLDWLVETGHELVPPVPSLFTFNMSGNPVTGLMGVSVQSAKIQIEETKLEASGPLLITHWGMSGPAVLKLSSLAARYLAGKNYDFNLLVSWMTDITPEELQKILLALKTESGSKQIYSQPPFDLPKRLWMFLLHRISLPESIRWADLSKEQVKKLTAILSNDSYKVRGKTTFKEEFVTCGGVSLDDIDFKTMESRKCKGVYFAGEVVDIDALTGGFNFQSAWTTGFIAGLNMGT